MDNESFAHYLLEHSFVNFDCLDSIVMLDKVISVLDGNGINKYFEPEYITFDDALILDLYQSLIPISPEILKIIINQEHIDTYINYESLKNDLSTYLYLTYYWSALKDIPFDTNIKVNIFSNFTKDFTFAPYDSVIDNDYIFSTNNDSYNDSNDSNSSNSCDSSNSEE
jgi:hypothetical protein